MVIPGGPAEMSPLLTKVDVEFVELFTVEFVSMLLLQLMHCSENL